MKRRKSCEWYWLCTTLALNDNECSIKPNVSLRELCSMRTTQTNHVCSFPICFFPALFPAAATWDQAFVVLLFDLLVCNGLIFPTNAKGARRILSFFLVLQRGSSWWHQLAWPTQSAIFIIKFNRPQTKRVANYVPLANLQVVSNKAFNCFWSTVPIQPFDLLRLRPVQHWYCESKVVRGCLGYERVWLWIN